MNLVNWIKQPWPWYVSGPIIGLIVPLLLIMGNKVFGISSALRHICAACIPANVPYFKYDWKKEAWNIFFVLGIVLGAALSHHFLSSGDPIRVSGALMHDLEQYRVTDRDHLVPADLFNWKNLFSVKGFILMVAGGFLVGFGTRYAGGCTSGHSISGLSNLQFPSLVATVCFMAGGFVAANLIIPFVLAL